MCIGQTNLGELVPLFYHVAPRDQIRVIRLGSKCLYILIFVQQIKHRFYHQATLEFPSTRLKKKKENKSGPGIDRLTGLRAGGSEWACDGVSPSDAATIKICLLGSGRELVFYPALCHLVFRLYPQYG